MVTTSLLIRVTFDDGIIKAKPEGPRELPFLLKPRGEFWSLSLVCLQQSYKLAQWFMKHSRIHLRVGIILLKINGGIYEQTR